MERLPQNRSVDLVNRLFDNGVREVGERVDAVISLPAVAS
jgi:hypothetical protein